MSNGEFDERWLTPNGIVPVDMPTTGALVREIQRLRNLCGEADQRDAARYRWLREHFYEASGSEAGPESVDAIVNAGMSSRSDTEERK